MSEYFFSVALDRSRTLCLAPLTDQCVAKSGQEIPDQGGYFLFERFRNGNCEEVEILAQATSEEAVFRLRELFKMA